MKEPSFLFFQKAWKRRILSCLIAIFWWWKVQFLTEVDQIFLDVPVFIKNIPNGLYLSYEQSNSIHSSNLILRGKKNKLNLVNPSDLRVVLDLSKSPKNCHLHTVTSQEIYMKNTPLADGTDLKSISNPQIHIALVEKIQKTAPVQVILPHLWEQKILTYAPQKLKQQIRGTERSIQKQLQVGLFWPIPERVLTQAYEEFLVETSESGVCLKLSPEQRIVHLPALSKEPKIITDPRLSQLHVFFVPQSDRQYAIDLPVKASQDAALTQAKSIFPSTYTIPFKGLSPLFLESAQSYLFLHAYWQSEACLTLSLGVTDLLQWKKNFVEMYSRRIQKQTDLDLMDLKRVAEKFFAHYLMQLRLESCFLERVENFLQQHSSIAKVVINQ